MATMEGEDDFYHRRLDRGPENAEFQHLPKQDKQLISQLRSAVESARGKVTKMRDDMEDKDLDLSREAALRKAAETRLEQLVDMYGDPAVNEELRQRLPRARVGDPKHRIQAELEDQLSRDDARGEFVSGRRPAGLDDIETQVLTPGAEGARLRSKSAEGTNRGKRGRKPRSHDENSDSEDDYRSRPRSHSPPRSRRHRDYPDYHRGHYPYPGPYPGYYPPPPHHMYGYPPPMMYQQPLMSSPPYPGQSNMPAGDGQSQESTTQGGGATQMGPPQMGPPPMGMMIPGPPGILQITQPVMPSNVPLLANGMLGVSASSPMPANQTFNQGGTPSSPANHMHPNGIAINGLHQSETFTGPQGTFGQSHQPGAMGPGAGMGSANSIASGPVSQTDAPPSAKELTIQREQNRQISLLLAELDAARDLNKKLQEKLSTTEKELKSTSLAGQTKDKEHQAELSGKVTEMLQEIYRAQKERDEAVMGRLKNANEERDEALLKLKRLEGAAQGLDTEDLANVDSNLQSLLSSMLSSESGQQMGQYGGVLIEAIQSRRRRRQDITHEEMKSVLEDRDRAVSKCKQLENEMLKLQRQNRAKNTDRQQQAVTQAKLLAMQQERDMAQNKVRKLEEELQTLRVYYSLHKSLSQEANLRDQFNNTLENIEGELKIRDDTINIAQKENNGLVAQLRVALADKQRVTEELDKAQAAHREAENNCEKLERLVNVLRRKINGLGSKLDD